MENEIKFYIAPKIEIDRKQNRLDKILICNPNKVAFFFTHRSTITVVSDNGTAVDLALAITESQYCAEIFEDLENTVLCVESFKDVI